jgi:hypothetical protein
VQFYINVLHILKALGMILLTIPLGIYLLSWLFYPLETLAYTVAFAIGLGMLVYYGLKFIVWIKYNLKQYTLSLFPEEIEYDNETPDFPASLSSREVKFLPLVGGNEVVRKTIEYMEEVGIERINLDSKEYVNAIRFYIEPDQNKRKNSLPVERFQSIILSATDHFRIESSSKGKPVAVLIRPEFGKRIELIDLIAYIEKNIAIAEKAKSDPPFMSELEIIERLESDLDICKQLQKAGLDNTVNRRSYERVLGDYKALIEKESKSIARVESREAGVR